MGFRVGFRVDPHAKADKNVPAPDTRANHVGKMWAAHPDHRQGPAPHHPGGGVPGASRIWAVGPANSGARPEPVTGVTEPRAASASGSDRELSRLATAYEYPRGSYSYPLGMCANRGKSCGATSASWFTPGRKRPPAALFAMLTWIPKGAACGTSRPGFPGTIPLRRTAGGFGAARNTPG